MPNITEYLQQIQALTNKNLKILSALNESFYSRKHHLSVIVDDEQYTIPSFLTIENKLNSLQANFDNLVNAPSTGDAYMTFDGNTQKIQLMGYSQTPHKIDLPIVKTFDSVNNDIFKDFITPYTYMRFGIPSIDNCTKNVNVKKIVLKTSQIQSLFDVSSLTTADPTKNIEYGEVRQKLYNFTEDVDFVEYDRLYRLPLRSNNASGEYIIKNIISKSFNDNYLEYYTLELDNLNYYIDSDTIQRTIQVGDQLVTNTDKAKLEVLAVRQITNEIDIKVLNNAYADLGDESTGIEDMYKLHYFRSINFNDTKYIDIPLEEDQYIILFVAPINDTTNIKGNYGSGVIINTFELTNSVQTFETYYNTNVNNIGDTLFGITSIIDNTINNLTSDQFNNLITLKPVFDDDLITVTQINKHLNDSESVQNIRRLYTQKSKNKTDLETIQNEIDSLNLQISSTSFDDTTNSIQLYKEKLNDLNQQKQNLIASISSIVTEISQNVNSSEVPIENAKYHIRGFLPIPTDTRKVIKIDVEYRYKNLSKFTGNAVTIKQDYIYSDWNKLNTPYNIKLVSMDNNKFKFEYESDNDQKNQISWNQIDIPISQGETVDIRYRYIYDYCFPFAECRSDWSNIKNIKFPEEYLENISILDIIEENNNDVKNEQLRSILVKDGIIEHKDNRVDDQDIRYFHTPDRISSGFYTDERRIIPLFDKLLSLDDIVNRLESEVFGATSDNLQVTLYNSNYSQILDQFNTNVFEITDYTSNTNRSDWPFNFTIQQSPFTGHSLFAYEQLTLDFYNAGIYDMKFFTSFPGAPANTLTYNLMGCNGLLSNNYTSNVANRGIFWQSGDHNAVQQKFNQWIYFRTNNIFDNSISYYTDKPDLFSSDQSDNEYKKSDGIGQCPPATNSQSVFTNTSYSSLPSTLPQGTYKFITAYPIDSFKSKALKSYTDIKMSCQCDSGEKYIVLKAGEHLQVMIGVWYVIGGSFKYVDTKLSFDVRTSLYQDPINYEITIKANNNPDLTSKVQKEQTQFIKTQTKTPYHSVIINNTGNNIKGSNSAGNR